MGVYTRNETRPPRPDRVGTGLGSTRSYPSRSPTPTCDSVRHLTFTSPLSSLVVRTPGPSHPGVSERPVPLRNQGTPRAQSGSIRPCIPPAVGVWVYGTHP